MGAADHSMTGSIPRSIFTGIHAVHKDPPAMSLKPDDPSRPQWSSKDPWSPIDRPPGAYPPSPFSDASRHSFSGPRTTAEAMKLRKDEYVRKKTIKVKVGTWNVAALSDAHKDLGGWFAEGLGIKGLKQDLAGSKTGSESSSEDNTSDSEVENVVEQESRHHKKASTLPRHDSPGEASGKEVDLYVLGLQEVIDVSSVADAMRPYTDPNPGRKWKRALRQKLPRGYKKVVEQQLIGLLLLVFASPQLAPEISSVDSTSVGTGLMGYLGNKGAVSARILVGETTRMLFVNSHLAAGADASALSRRIWDTQQIISRTKFHPVGDEWVGGIGQSEKIGDEDIAFWFGDLNYRLDDIPGEDVRRLLLLHARNEYDVLNKSKRRIDSELGYVAPVANDTSPISHDDSSEIELPATESMVEPSTDPQDDPTSLLTTVRSLFTHDQLRAQQRARKAFHEGWREGEINFLPTYKYDVGSVAMFDTGEKKRSPSWCDRILYRTRHDYEAYFQRVSQEAEAEKKDEDMKRRGLDDAASQEDVLFDYDPEADGDGDEHEDQTESHSDGGKLKLIRTKEGFEDTIQLENYVSHQRVLSSDHKPLSAVFKLTYDSVDPVLKAQVHKRVTKDLDNAENEARPMVTLVLDNHSPSISGTDKSPEFAELKCVDFGEVRYHVPSERHLTIANTGRLDVVFAFIDRPTVEATSSPIPSWLNVIVHQELDKAKPAREDLGDTARYRLRPGETADIDMAIEITNADMVKTFNDGDTVLDDVLILRISSGRDHFLPIKGTWLQSSFFRSVDELVRVPSGVRSLTVRNEDVPAQDKSQTKAGHSAPKEIFTMTDIIPKLIERVVADWEMLHDGEESPWKKTAARPWPFSSELIDHDPIQRDKLLAECREALDRAEPLDDYLGPDIKPAERLELVSAVLLSFLNSLSDGIITTKVWQQIDLRMTELERSKIDATNDAIQDIVMEAISGTPVHSVSLTFITFMLNRIISEVTADAMNQGSSMNTPVARSRSSTSASAMSNISLSSVTSDDSSNTRSWIPSLTRRTTNLSSVTSQKPTARTVTETNTALRTEKTILGHRYAELFAPIIIRSEESKLKAKEKKAQSLRKVKALEAFLNHQP